MNSTWERILEEGQKAIGYLDIYTTVFQGNNVKAVINYMPQFPKNSFKKDAHITLYYEGTKSELTDSKLMDIFNDILDIIRTNEANKYPEAANQLSYVLTQVFIVDRIPNIEYYSHGDFGWPGAV